jgi:hypothetical protein
MNTDDIDISYEKPVLNVMSSEQLLKAVSYGKLFKSET